MLWVVYGAWFKSVVTSVKAVMLCLGKKTIVGFSISFVAALNPYYLQGEKHQVGHVSILQQRKKANPHVCPSFFNMGYVLSMDLTKKKASISFMKRQLDQRGSAIPLETSGSPHYGVNNHSGS